MASRLSLIDEPREILTSLKNAMYEYAFIRKYSYGTYFANLLGFHSRTKESSLANVINADGDKNLTLKEFIFVLDSLDTEQQKKVISSVGARYGFLVSNESRPVVNNEELKDCLLNISAEHGKIISDFLLFNSDNYLDNDEKRELIKSISNTRSSLKSLENQLKQGLKDEV